MRWWYCRRIDLEFGRIAGLDLDHIEVVDFEKWAQMRLIVGVVAAAGQAGSAGWVADIVAFDLGSGSDSSLDLALAIVPGDSVKRGISNYFGFQVDLSWCFDTRSYRGIVSSTW